MTSESTVGVLIHDNVTMIDVAGPADVFHHANGFGANYRTLLISAGGADAVASNGLRLHADCRVADAPAVDTVIVPGAYGMVNAPLPRDLVAAVATLNSTARRTASVCTGSFLLAEAGLLRHRRATTHWTQLRRFQRVYPDVHVDDDVLFVRDGDITTAAGIGSGVDLALSFVEDDHGPALAHNVVRQMVLHMQRPGGLPQLSTAARAAVPADRPLRVLLDAITTDPAQDLGLPDMARIANVSVRQLARLFDDELGTPPRPLRHRRAYRDRAGAPPTGCQRGGDGRAQRIRERGTPAPRVHGTPRDQPVGVRRAEHRWLTRQNSRDSRHTAPWWFTATRRIVEW